MKILPLFVLLIFNILSLKADHITGGEVHYECKGVNDNKIELDVFFTKYRDCSIAENLPFYPTLRIGIYSGSDEPYDDYGIHLASKMEQSYVENPIFNCLNTPTNTCIEKAIYLLNISLPISDDKYVIVHQECCRSIVISNIVAPELTGTTQFIEITPEGQQLCNSSPNFTSSIPSFLCVNQPFLFDNSLMDKEGDVVKYVLCSPFTSHENDASLCGISNLQPCPPPYQPVSFLEPFYKYDRPLGENAIWNLNEQTGALSILPRSQGQFVASLCYEEYRGNLLLSRTIRDMQFNITECDSVFYTVTEELDTPYLLCGDSLLSIENNSYPEDEIDRYEWNVSSNDGFSFTSNFKDLILNIPHEGYYDVSLQTTGIDSTCVTKVYEQILYVKDIPKADFDYSPLEVTTIESEVSFSNHSENGQFFNWLFDDGSSFYKEDITYSFIDTGYQTITLAITDQYGCKDSITKVVDVVPTVTYHLPNAFTPNGDGKNDIFIGKGITEYIRDFQLTIWNRWGNKVFETNNVLEGWNGLYFNSGKEIPSGVYILSLSYSSTRGEIVTDNGYITLIR